MKSEEFKKFTKSCFVAVCLAAALATTGCQMSVGGQTLPSPYYMMDDIHYAPAGPEFKLSREAAAMSAAKAEQDLYQDFYR